MIVVITGASKGIGRAIAEKFAAQGHTLILCARSLQQLTEAADAMQAAYPNCVIYYKAVDIGVKEEVDAFAAWILQTAGIPGIIVNNAAWFINSSIHSEDDGVLQGMMATNLYGAYYLTRALLKGMMQKQSGHIFNICSIASFKGAFNGGSYSISKFALAGFTKNLREEMKPYGIKVTGVYPGSVYTESWHGSNIDPQSIIPAQDVAGLIYAASQLSPQACAEDIIILPQDTEKFSPF
ncbi:MAG TPA: SDR family oxidoreductase [Chitinophagaceae bacterium]|nr:SDR family oxidoreductase [Chitinophagaceae bacterium]